MRKIFLLITICALVTSVFGAPQHVPKAHAAVRVNHLGISGKGILSGTVNPPNLKNGLVGHWTFDGKDMRPNARDVSGQGNHGQLAGFAATTTVPGKFGQALDFDGSDDYVTISDHTSLDQASSYSVGAWVNADSLLNQNWDSIVTKGSSGDGGGNDHNYLLGYNNNGGIGTTDRWLFLLENSSGTNCNLVGNAAAVRGQWYFVMGVFDDGADLSQIYVNGVKQNEIACALTVTTNANPVRIGDDEDTVGAPWNGRIDDVRVYSRALTASEVAQLYKLGTGSHQSMTTSPGGLQNGLVGHWTFDGKDMTSTNALDRSGQRNNGGLAGNLVKIPGRLGQALQFNGTDTYINVSASSSLSNWSAQSIAFWFKTTGSSQFTRLIEKGANNEWTVYWDSGIVVPTLGASSPVLVASQLGLGNNKWHHAVITISSNDPAAVKMYIDGILVDSDTATQPAGKTNGISIGRFSGTGYNFNGSMDDIRVYTRELSAAEALQLYNLGR